MFGIRACYRWRVFVGVFYVYFVGRRLVVRSGSRGVGGRLDFRDGL